jgi:hypothetical protein
MSRHSAAHYFLEGLVDLGVDYIFANLGTDQHPELPSDHPHLHGEPSGHAHVYVIDNLHHRWP